MIKAILSDFSRVLIFPTDTTYTGLLNDFYRKLIQKKNYDFWVHFKLNDELLDYYRTLSKKIDLYMLTSEYIQEDPVLEPKLKGVFKQVFSALRLDINKKDPKGYARLIEIIGIKPEEILFIDDNLPNLKAAQQAGVKTIQYTTNQDLIKQLDSLNS